MLYGVSPAFYISRYTSHFSKSNFFEGMALLSEYGFDATQMEIFHSEQWEDWRNGGAAEFKAEAESLGLKVSQFVAHFLLYSFSDAEALTSSKGEADWKEICELVSEVSLTEVITVPLGAYADKESRNDAEVNKAFKNKVKKFRDIAEAAGLLFAVEVLPGSLAEDFGIFNELDRVGLNFDTGHAHFSGQDVYSIPERLKERITGTHLCENDGVVNRSDRPNELFDWDRILKSLVSNGYKGSVDLEIICKREDVESEYKKGLLFFKDIMNTK